MQLMKTWTAAYRIQALQHMQWKWVAEKQRKSSYSLLVQLTGARFGGAFESKELIATAMLVIRDVEGWFIP